jgi:hypothetical protein
LAADDQSQQHETRAEVIHLTTLEKKQRYTHVHIMLHDELMTKRLPGK